jgi:lysophospholipase L1-like esterase
MNIKRIFTITAIIISALLLFAAVTVSAAGSVVAPNGYVALGDSIAYGYGLSDIPAQCYTSIVASGLGTNLINYAVNGMTSDGLLIALENLDEGTTGRTQLQNAALITVSIGSNDLLSKLSGVWNMMSGSEKAGTELYAALEASLTSDEKLAEFASGVETYSGNLPKIYTALRNLNPSAQIIMTEFYNPYYGVMLGAFDFGALSDKFIVQMNDVLHAGQTDMNYKIAPVYDAFNKPSLTNVDMSSLSLDPHPNNAGHAIFAEAVLSMVDYTALPVFAPVTEETVSTGNEVSNGSSILSTAAEETTSQASDNTENKSIIGAVILAVVAVSAFAVTGVIISKRSKRDI